MMAGIQKNLFGDTMSDEEKKLQDGTHPLYQKEV